MFDFNHQKTGFSFHFPTSTYEPESLLFRLSKNIDIEKYELHPANGNCFELTVSFFKDQEQEDRIARLFGEINGFPVFDLSEMKNFQHSSRPLVSCIILLTANDLFTYRFLIPGIIASSRDYPIEIIIVYNGLACDLSLFTNFPVHPSMFGCVSKGYNKGVQMAKGEWIAIFHDDCIIDDPSWIPKALSGVRSGVTALTPEIQVSSETGLTTAKNVPLVMHRKEFDEMGGYDEEYYAGLEDVDFTYHLLSSGKKIEKLEIQYFHFDGMSTTIMMDPAGKTLKELYGLHMLPRTAISQLRTQLFQQKGSAMRLVAASGMLRIIEKFGPYLQQTGLASLVQHQQQLTELVSMNKENPLIKNHQSLADLYQSQLDNHEYL